MNGADYKVTTSPNLHYESGIRGNVGSTVQTPSSSSAKLALLWSDVNPN